MFEIVTNSLRIVAADADVPPGLANRLQELADHLQCHPAVAEMIRAEMNKQALPSADDAWPVFQARNAYGRYVEVNMLEVVGEFIKVREADNPTTGKIWTITLDSIATADREKVEPHYHAHPGSRQNLIWLDDGVTYAEA